MPRVFPGGGGVREDLGDVPAGAQDLQFGDARLGDVDRGTGPAARNGEQGGGGEHCPPPPLEPLLHFSRRLLLQIAPPFGVGGDADLDQVRRGSDLGGNPGGRGKKRRRRVLRVHGKSVVPLAAPAVASRDLEFHLLPRAPVPRRLLGLRPDFMMEARCWILLAMGGMARPGIDGIIFPKQPGAASGSASARAWRPGAGATFPRQVALCSGYERDPSSLPAGGECGTGASPVLGLGASKLAAGVRGRRRAHELLASWGRGARDARRPAVWVHAPSVGEGLQARGGDRGDADATLRSSVRLHALLSLRGRHGARHARRDFGVSPWDLRSPIGSVLKAMAPRLLVFTKTEVWPVLADEAARRGIPVCLAAATLPEDAGRLRASARWLLKRAWEELRLACAVTAEDAERLRGLASPETGSQSPEIRVWIRPSAAPPPHRTRPSWPLSAPIPGRRWWRARHGRPTRIFCSRR